MEMVGSGKKRSGDTEAVSSGECSLTSPDSEIEIALWARLQHRTAVTQRLREGMGHREEELKEEKTLF